MGREKSDDRVVAQGGVTADKTAATRGAKAITASNGAAQLGLFTGSAESPRGANAGAVSGLPVSAPREVHQPANANDLPLPAMTMEEVASEQNLQVAMERVRANRGAPGPDRQTVEQVFTHWSRILPKLHAELLDGSYKPGDVRRVWIAKAGGGERGLGIPNVVDRIVQQAVHQVLSPNYEPEFHNSSHGFRPGRSCHTAIAQAQQFVQAGYEWIVDMDLEKFFDTVHHDRLISRLRERISDKRLLALIGKMLRARVVLPDGLTTATTEGTPQGGPLSPLLSNIVLDELDHELTRRGHRFVRYADDCNIYVQSERAGHRVMESIVRFIEKRLRLKVNRKKSAVAKPQERHFVGFRLWRDPRTGAAQVLLSQRSHERITARIRDLTPRKWGRSFADCLGRLNSYLVGWIGFFRICSDTTETYSQLRSYDAHIRRRLRAIRLKQCKRRRTMVHLLQNLGVKRHTATRAVYDGWRSVWALSQHMTISTRAMPNRWFAEQGLESLTERWKFLRPSATTVLVPVRTG